VPPDASLCRLRIRVDGIVQGVGFRPFVHGLATSLRLAGLVGNDTAGVFIEVEGARDAVTRFVSGLERDHPPLAVIERIDAQPVPATGEHGFFIAGSDSAGEPHALVSADTATCGDCLRELFDPADRRYRYPFINCTNCGPRFTIIRGVPYDRPLTTMAGFTMCPDCSREYHDPRDRRFHAQPTCCPACGPSLRLSTPEAGVVPGDPIGSAARLLREGLVVAVKGLGGYHLAVLAACEPAAAALRSRKHREHKPFAVMVAHVDAGRDLCEIDPAEERALTSPRRPIVLLRRRLGAQVAPSVAPGNRFLGLMLPYTPLHHLLARELAVPFVLTSGNIGDEPIAFDDADARDRLAGIADAFLAHDRPIHIRTDDSVTRVAGGRRAVLRRSRGFVPEPLMLAEPLRRPVLACGAELKNTFCVAKGRRAFVSHHIGDLENYETLRSFRAGIAHFSRLFGIRPEVVAHDLHPEYLSTKYALDLAGDGLPDARFPGVELVGVQHHHAHVAACLADNKAAGPVIGVAFDGLGFGTDGTLWGGEFLVADLVSFQRFGHLQPVPLPGGAAAIREPWRMAAAYLDAAFEGNPPSRLAVARAHAKLWQPVVAMARGGLNSPLTSSAGRLFDAVSAMLGACDRISYEGQAAVELEQLADPAERSAYRGVFLNAEPFSLLGTGFVHDVADDLRAGTPRPVIAARFHNGLADAVVAGCERIRDSTGLASVALSGGVFQNMLLTDRVRTGLAERGFDVLLHSQVPPNDGGISLGQAIVAGARDTAG
jgi:hydrogenase maturation protein HypF